MSQSETGRPDQGRKLQQKLTGRLRGQALPEFFRRSMHKEDFYGRITDIKGYENSFS